MLSMQVIGGVTPVPILALFTISTFLLPLWLKVIGGVSPSPNWIFDFFGFWDWDWVWGTGIGTMASIAVHAIQVISISGAL